MRHQIAKLVKDGLYKEAILLYTRHHSASIPPTNFTFPYILKACAELNAITHGQIMHAHILKSGYTNKHTTTDLTNMYLQLGFVDSAGKLFEEIPRPSVSIINVAISGLLHNGLTDVGFGLFKRYGVRDLRFDSITLASVSSACRDVVNGVQLHCFVVKTGLELDVEASTSLITMYFNCGELDSAVKLFGFVECKNVIFYNAYISGLVQNGFPEMALRVFKEMRSLSFQNNPNVVTIISALSGCGSGKCVRFGQQLHGFIVKVGFNLDAAVGTGLVDMYSKCGSWQYAYGVFKEMGSNRNLVTWTSMIAGMMLNEKCENAIDLFAELECEEGLEANLVTWNSMISGFSHLGKMDEAFSFFRKMISCGVTPNAQCITSFLAACSSLYGLYYGRQIHAYVLRMKLFVDEFLATAIIDMYMKCGLPSLANNVFCQLHIKPSDPASWNAMIFGYGRNGKCEAAFDIFNQMIECRLKPNLATFSCLLFVCSQTGQVEEGFHIFRLMTAEYGLHPTSKQINILIDLLGRSGRLNEAFELLQAIDKPSASAFASLLCTSEHYTDLRLEEIAGRLLDLEPENPIPFVILSNIYAGQEKWKDVHKIRKLMDKKRLKKLPAISSIGPA